MAASLWPWLAVAALGALHGLNPANGWMFAAACGVRAGDSAQARRALLPLAVGHAASIALVACAVAQGLSMGRARFQGLAGALLVSAAAYRVLRGAGWRMPFGARIGTGIGLQAGRAGLALWSFLMASAHGAGLMLVPALAPLCLADNPAREITASGSLVLALAAVGVHMAAMLLTTGAVATGVCRGTLSMLPRLSGGALSRQAWTVVLVVTGVLLMLLR